MQNNDLSLSSSWNETQLRLFTEIEKNVVRGDEHQIIASAIQVIEGLGANQGNLQKFSQTQTTPSFTKQGGKLFIKSDKIAKWDSGNDYESKTLRKGLVVDLASRQVFACLYLGKKINKHDLATIKKLEAKVNEIIEKLQKGTSTYDEYNRARLQKNLVEQLHQEDQNFEFYNYLMTICANESEVYKSFNSKVFPEIKHFNIFEYTEKTYNVRSIFQTFFGFDLLNTAVQDMSIKEKLKLSLAIVNKVGELHSQNVFHGDLKFDNILCNKELDVRLIDAETTLRPGSKEFELLKYQVKLTICPPEEFDEIIPENYRNRDIWALGIIFYQIFAGMNLDYNHTDFSSPLVIPNNQKILEIEVINEILKGIIKLDPLKRITLEQIRAQLNEVINL